jgi:membrane-associated phospholipid phosphatase
VLPSVWAAAALLLGGSRGLALLLAGFGSFWLYESRRLDDGLPPDYLALRRQLSIAVCALLALTVLASEPVR